MEQTKTTREANWTIIYRDAKLNKDYYIYDIIALDNFTCTSKKEEAIRLCYSEAKLFADTIKRYTGYNLFIDLL